MIRQFDEHTALLLIDVQKGVDDGAYYGTGKGDTLNNPASKDNIRALLDRARVQGMTVAFTRHDSIEPNSPLKLSKESGQQIAGLEIAPRDIQVSKSSNSGFIGTSLELDLRRAGILRLVVAGFFTNFCVETTVRMAGNMGFDTYLVHDACATMPRKGLDGTLYDGDLVHNMALASMHGEFCTAITTAEALALFDGDAPHLERVQGNETGTAR
ncbi:cysteine hydrolase family protein [Salaquimonas pukyongi]|uniref:cysteine hydrolase family protein n=1 Tax=Salaquimonas pukyongi TaxID=2712698 RepID=UPI00096BC4BF|nr:cysteine hydrolase family protein [Salaquimonas pukyongi]